MRRVHSVKTSSFVDSKSCLLPQGTNTVGRACHAPAGRVSCEGARCLCLDRQYCRVADTVIPVESLGQAVCGTTLYKLTMKASPCHGQTLCLDLQSLTARFTAHSQGHALIDCPASLNIAESAHGQRNRSLAVQQDFTVGSSD